MAHHKLSLNLRVCALPRNRLALTNHVYLSPSNHAALLASSYPTALASRGLPLASVGRHLYAAEPCRSVPDDGVALSAPQRRFTGLAVGDAAAVRPFARPRVGMALSYAEFGVEPLGWHPPLVRPPDVDTEGLYHEVLVHFADHVLETGQMLVMGFGAVRVELTVKELRHKNEGSHEHSISSDIKVAIGFLEYQTEMAFAGPRGAAVLSLTGARVKGSFFMAVRLGSLDDMMNILEECPTATSERDSSGKTPLHCALDRKAPSEIVRFLVERDPKSLEFKDRHGWTPLHTACERGASLRLLKLFAKKCPQSLEEKDDCGRTALYHACWSRDRSLDNIRFLVYKYPEALEEKDDRLWTPLHCACNLKARVQVLRVIAGRFSKALEMKDAHGWTPLHLACNRTPFCNCGCHPCNCGTFNIESVRFLAEKFPQALGDKDNSGLTPLHSACFFGAPLEMVQLLVEKFPGALSERNNRGHTPLESLQMLVLTHLERICESEGKLSISTTLAFNSEGKIPILHSNEQFARDKILVPEVLELLTALHRLFNLDISIKEIRRTLSRFSSIEWWGGVILVIEAHPSIVHVLGLNNGVFPDLFCTLGRKCKLQTIWEIVKGYPSLSLGPNLLRQGADLVREKDVSRKMYPKRQAACVGVSSGSIAALE